MIQELELADLKKVNCFLTDLKNRNITDKDLNNGLHQYVVYKQDGLLIGFMGYSIYYDRAELDYLYIDKYYRNLNIGSNLLDYLFNYCREKCYNITLEVSIDNINAIKLYEKKGFKRIKVITNYYKDKDGVLMIKELD